MKKRSFESVWDAIESDPREAAKLLGVTQPRVSDLIRGKIDLFSLETLIDMLARAGAQVKLSVHFNKRAA